MARIPFSKSPLTYRQQLEQLQSRGMLISNESKALHLLEHISYYRLSGYWYPLLADKSSHIFKPDAAFDTAFQLYFFDKELRKVVLSNAKKA